MDRPQREARYPDIQDAPASRELSSPFTYSYTIPGGFKEDWIIVERRVITGWLTSPELMVN